METARRPPATAPDLPVGVDYPTWINDRIRAELKRVRLALGKSTCALAVPGALSDQSILDIESGKHSPSLKTLALLCRILGTTVEAVVLAAIRPEKAPNSPSILG